MEKLIKHREFAKENPRSEWNADHKKARRQAALLDLLGKTNLSATKDGDIINHNAIIYPSHLDLEGQAAHREDIIHNSLKDSFEKNWKTIDIESRVNWASYHINKKEEAWDDLVKASVDRLAADDAKKQEYHQAWADLKKIIWK